ncbi:MAG TPA: hypothetical protein VFZ54_01120 [Burkholderiales bacterium]
MKTTLVSVSIALALGTLAACDRNPNPTQSPATPPANTAGTGSSAATPSTPANAGVEKKDGGQPPVQGQVDAKQAPQQKDFQQKGDGAGPKPGG